MSKAGKVSASHSWKLATERQRDRTNVEIFELMVYGPCPHWYADGRRHQWGHIGHRGETVTYGYRICKHCSVTREKYEGERYKGEK